VELNINTNFKVSNTKVWINVIALASDNASITLNGNIHIEENIKNVEAKLYEETLLLWNAKYISLIPWLRVDSPDVKATHWAKVQRISPERLFYMQSRGLSKEKAMNMIINSYSQQIADKLEFDETKKSEFILCYHKLCKNTLIYY
jgi:Fe-S cluster assembly scaffold protein SufB